MICWFCHWGWAKPVQDIYDKYSALVGESNLEYGHSHSVWADENFDDESISWCLENNNKYRREFATDEDVAFVDESLRELLKVPLKFREAPEDYDGENPAAYPPPEGYFG